MKTNTISRVFILTFTTLLTIFFLFFSGCSLINKDDDSEEAKSPYTVIGEYPTNDILDMPSALAFSAVTAEESDGQLLTATISPNDAYDKSVSWTVSWLDSNSGWASGKTVTDYVTITPTADGSNEAVIKCLQAFGSQIILKVTSRANPDVSAQSTVDFFKRIKDSINLKFYQGSYDPDASFTEDNSDYSIRNSVNLTKDISNSQIYTLPYTTSYSPVYMQFIPDNALEKLNKVYLDEVGTITPEVTVEASFELSPVLSSNVNELVSKTSDALSIGDYAFDISGSSATFGKLFGITSNNSANWTALRDAMLNNTDNYDVLFKFQFSSLYSNDTRYFKLNINEASMITPTSITLNSGSIIF